jgi:formylglycine-generating enzyme required for sulfatase activity
MTRRLAEMIGAMIAAALVMGAAAPRSPMVRVPEGVFRPLYGTSAPVTVGAFMIDRDPVTRGEYAEWRTGKAVTSADRDYPMVNVNLAEATAFCSARGERLPTLAEWEYAARETNTLALVSVYATRAIERPVGRAATNVIGIRGLHDLVWEWVSDPNLNVGPHAHHHMEGAGHDMSCAGAAIGANDTRDYPAFLRAAFRSGLTDSTRLPTLGFRCAM